MRRGNSSSVDLKGRISVLRKRLIVGAERLAPRLLGDSETLRSHVARDVVRSLRRLRRLSGPTLAPGVDRPFDWSKASRVRNRTTQQYEPIQPWLFLGCLDVLGAEVVLDVGANIGYYSLISSLAPGVRRVIGFEAAPVAAAEFRENVYLNALADRITVEECAVADYVGEAEFLIHSKTSGINALAYSTMHDRLLYVSTPLVVKTTTLDAWTSAHVPPQGALAIKIDVEGAEVDVLRGGEHLLAGREIILQVETYETNQVRVGEVLRRLGYTPLLRCSHDWYWTNSDRLIARWAEVVEIATTNCVRAHRGEWPPVHRATTATQADSV